MRRRNERPDEEGLLKEYDFSKGVRGKFYKRYQESSNVVVIAADLAKIFPDSKSVNEALRSLVKLAEKTAAAK